MLDQLIEGLDAASNRADSMANDDDALKQMLIDLKFKEVDPLAQGLKTTNQTVSDLGKTQASLNDTQTKALADATEKLNQALALKADKANLPNLTDYAKKSDLPSTAGLVKETELVDYAKKSDLPSTEGLAKETELADYAKKTDIPQTLAWGQVTGKPNLATSADVDDLRAQIAKAGQEGDAGLSIEAIAELVKSRVHAAIDPTSGHLAITIDDTSSDTIAEAVVAKVAGSLSFAMNSNGDLIASVGR